MILERIWDQSFEGLTNVVDVYIGYLRRKIDEGQARKYIRTVRGLGYMFDVDGDAA
jgi:two-component system copper resistance phosphate regulon response regulator CusR